jgi:transposase-like protein
MFELTHSIYTDANAAREYLEATHWPNGPVCPHCGNVDGERITLLKGKSTRPGVRWCNECDKPFSVMVGTIFEDSKIPLNKWLLAFRLMASSKKGISAHQLHRSLGITYKSAWFMAHRIREAMRLDDAPSAMGGPGKPIQADETYYGDTSPRSKAAKQKRRNKHGNKARVVALVCPETGEARAIRMERATAKTVQDILFIRGPQE